MLELERKLFKLKVKFDKAADPPWLLCRQMLPGPPAFAAPLLLH